MWCGSGDRQARHITTFVLQVRAPRLTTPATDDSSAIRFVAEIALLAVLLFNVVQASYALKYPRVPPPPPPSPARKAKDTPLSPARQWRLSSSTTPNVRSYIEQLWLELTVDLTAVQPTKAEGLLVVRAIARLDTFAHSQLHDSRFGSLASRRVIRVVDVDSWVSRVATSCISGTAQCFCRTCVSL